MSESFLELTRARRSVRKYAATPVPREAIERCLEAARLAPSACNAQPWFFVVADRDPLRRSLADAAFGGVYAMNAFAKSAPVLVAVLAERTEYAAALGGFLRRVAYNLVDVGIAGEHFALQAAAEGLGTCWLGWFDERAVKRVLNLPRNAHVPILISVGYPADLPDRVLRRKTPADMRRYAEQATPAADAAPRDVSPPRFIKHNLTNGQAGRTVPGEPLQGQSADRPFAAVNGPANQGTPATLDSGGDHAYATEGDAR
jgi:nitroreductase